MGAEKPTKAIFILREFGNQYIFGDFKKHLKNKSFICCQWFSKMFPTNFYRVLFGFLNPEYTLLGDCEFSRAGIEMHTSPIYFYFYLNDFI